MAWLKKLAWPVAALLALLSIFAGRRGKDRNKGGASQDDLKDALLGEINERKLREEAEEDALLEKERSLDVDSQFDAVMERVRKRRAEDDGS